MSVRTVRFNKQEEAKLKKLLSHYGKDFSGCIKELLYEKLEDLHDIRQIKSLKEGKRKDYYTANQINEMFK